METGPVVILWWNTEIRILTREGTIGARTLEGREDPVAALSQLLGKCPGTDRVRVVYHPANIDVLPLPCPNTSRSRLKGIFSGEHRALNLPHAVWSVEEVRRNLDGGGYNTILYIDNRSRMPQLTEALATQGIVVEGIWPLQTLIEASPPCSTADFGFISVLMVGNQSAISCVRPNGGRYLRLQDGPESPRHAAADLNAALSFFDGAALPVGLLVVESEAHAGVLREAAGELSLTATTLPDLLANARLLKPGGFSDFLQRGRIPMPTVPELAVLLAAALLAGSAWFSLSRYENERSWHRRLDALRAEHAQLERLVDSRRAVKDRIDRLNQAIGACEVEPQRHYELLLAVARAIPPELSLQSFITEGDRVEFKGRMFEDAGNSDGPLARFCRLLPANGSYWLLSPPAEGRPRKGTPIQDESAAQLAGAFTLRGRFGADGPVGD